MCFLCVAYQANSLLQLGTNRGGNAAQLSGLGAGLCGGHAGGHVDLEDHQ